MQEPVIKSKEIIAQASKDIPAALGEDLEALILVGSFARGEGIEGISDIELWAVVRDIARARSQQIPRKDISIGFTTRRHLSRLKPYIYTLEAKKYGKVLWGDSNILSLIPDYRFEGISAYDGFILFYNRLIEQLILYEKIEKAEDIPAYYFNKGYLQLVNALLVFHRQYRPLYAEKINAFLNLPLGGLEGLKQKAAASFNEIKAGPWRILKQEEAASAWLELRAYFEEVHKKARDYAPSWQDKAGDWLRALRKGNFAPQPRYLIYRRAARVYFSEGYKDAYKRRQVIADWERFVK